MHSVELVSFGEPLLHPEFGRMARAIAAASGFGLLTVTMEPWLVILGIGFAMLTGVLSGALPARQAAALQPVEALRA